MEIPSGIRRTLHPGNSRQARLSSHRPAWHRYTIVYKRHLFPYMKNVNKLVGENLDVIRKVGAPVTEHEKTSPVSTLANPVLHFFVPDRAVPHWPEQPQQRFYRRARWRCPAARSRECTASTWQTFAHPSIPACETDSSKILIHTLTTGRSLPTRFSHGVKSSQAILTTY